MKKKTKYLLALILWLGACHTASAAGTLRVHPANPRYFTDDSGKAIYLAGVDNYRALQDWDRFGVGSFDYGAFLDYLRSHHHNYLRLWSWEHHYCDKPGDTYRIFPPHVFRRTGPGKAKDGLLKFDLTKFDQAYFDRLRERCVEAGKRGVFVSVMLFQSFSLGKDQWNGHPFNGRNNINNINGDMDGDGEGYETHTPYSSRIKGFQEAYVKKVIDTVNDLDNVLYEIANESMAENGKINSVGAVVVWQHHMINFIHDYEKTKPKQHPVGMTMVRGAGGANNYLFESPAQWISPGGPWVEPAWQSNPPLADGRKVVIADTDHIHPAQPGGAGNQSWLWMCLTRGHSVNALDGDNEVEDRFSEEDSRVMGDTWRYANRINLASMLPSSNSRDCSTTFCLRNPGREYLVYQPSSNKAFTVNLLAGVYRYEWFDAVSGKVSGTGSISAANGNRMFTPPFSGGAVLYLEKKT